MSKSRARLLAELLNASGRVKKDKSDLAGADSIIDLDTLPTITNAKLENSSISIAGHSTALGGSVSLNTGDITEHTDYKYYTDARVRAAISVDGSLSYNSSTGVLSYTTPTTIASLSNHDTADLAEGTNLYFTNARARGAISVSGDLAYNSTTGVVSFTERTDAEVRGLVSAGGNLSYNSTTGVFSYTTPTTIASLSNHDTDDLSEGTNLYFTNARARGAISVSGSLSYNSSTGVISYTQPTNISTFTNDSSYITNATASLDASKITGGTLNYARIPIPTNGDWWNNGYVRVQTDGVMEVGKYLDFHTADSGGGTDYDVRVTASSGAIDIDGDLTVDDITAGAISATSYSGTLASSVTGTTQSASDNSTKVATTAYVDSAVSGIVDSAPGTLNTLNELAAALGDDANFSTTVTNSIATKLPLAGGTITGRVTFPTGSSTKPILAEGFYARTTGDTSGTHDIWGISGQYNPSASSAADQWGIQWSGSPNEINFIGAGQKKLSIDLDTAGLVKIDNNKVWHEGNDGTGSGLDADYLDGIQGSQFLRSDAGDTHTGGTITLGSGSSIDASSNDRYLSFRVIRNAGTANLDGMYIGYSNSNSGHTRLFGGGATSGGLYIRGSGANDLTYGNNTGVIWHSANDGAGSGLDADTVDSLHASSFLRSDAADTATGNLTFTGNISQTGGTFLSHGAQVSSLTTAWQAAGTSKDRGLYPFRFQNGATGQPESGDNAHWGLNIYAHGGSSGNYPYGTQLSAGSTQTLWHRWWANGSASAWRKIWDSSNDGASSGLDADTVDGIHGASFLRSDTSDSWNSLLTYNGSNNGLEVGGIRGTALGSQTGDFIHLYERVNIGYPSGWGASGAAAPAYGLSTWGGAQINIGNVSSAPFTFNGNNVWHAGNDGTGSGLDADTVDGVQASSIVYGSSARKTNNSNPNSAINSGFYDVYQTNAPTSTWYSYITMAHTNTANQHGHQIAGSFYSDGELFNRHYDGTTASFGNWTKIWNAANDGSGSGLDADYVDGIQGSQFLRSDAGDTATGNIVFSAATQYFRKNDATNYTNGSLMVESYGGASSIAAMGFHISGQLGRMLSMNSAGTLNWEDDVSISGSFLTPNTSGNGLRSANGANFFYPLDAYNNMHIRSTTGSEYHDSTAYYFRKVDQSNLVTITSSNTNIAAGTLTRAGNTVWDAGNDGSGSGLDADLLDGIQRSDLDHAEGFKTWSGINASAAQAKRYHIGRLYGCPAHWDGNWQNIEFHITAESYESGTLKYRVHGDYGGAGTQANMLKLILTEVTGPMSHRFRLLLGSPVDAGWDYSGADTFYMDLYAEAAYYSQWKVNAKTYGHPYQTSNPTSGGAVTVFYSSPTVSNVSDFNVTHTQSTIRLDTSGNQTQTAQTRLRAHSNGWEGGLALISQDASDTFQIHPDNNGYMYVDKNWYFTGDVHIGSIGTTAITTANIGSQSVSNADTVDSIHASSLLRSDADDSYGSTTSNKYLRFNCNSGQYISSGGASNRFPIEIFAPTANGGDAGITFHISGDYAGFFGLASDWNDLAWGGWSVGSTTKYRIWHSGNDGSGTGLDADTLDGLHSTRFSRFGSVYNSSTDWDTIFNTAGQYGQVWHEVNNGTSWTNGPGSSAYSYGGIFNYYGSSMKFQWYIPHTASSNNGMWYRTNWGGNSWYGWKRIWDSGNDGSGSGLDADLLDGVEGSAYLRANINQTMTGDLTIDSSSGWNSGNGMLNVGGSGDARIQVRHIWGKSASSAGTDHLWLNYANSGKHVQVGGSGSSGNNLYVAGTIYANGYFTGNRVLTTADEGSGQGLDADTLDGQHASAFLGVSAKAADSNLLDGLDSTDYRQYKWRSFTVGGDLDKFYPALFSVGNGNHGSSDLEIAQSNVHQNGSSHGAFYARFGLNVTGWGHVPQMRTLREYTKSGNTYISKIADTDHATGEIGIWLRGSTTYYYRSSDGAIFDSVRCTDNQPFVSYDHSNNAYDITITHATTVEDAIFNDSMHTGKVVMTSNIGNYAWTSANDGSGSGLDADLLDGNHGSAFVKSGAGASVSGWWINQARNGYNSGSNMPSIYMSHSSGYGLHINSYNTSGSIYNLECHNNSAQLFAVYNDGDIQVGGNNFVNSSRQVTCYSVVASDNITAYSDERLKENIEVIPNALEKVEHIRGVTFTRNDQEDKEKIHSGVIAQEVERVLPEVVDTDEEGIKSVAYGNMIGLLIEAVKELKQEVDDLKAQLKEK